MPVRGLLAILALIGGLVGSLARTHNPGHAPRRTAAALAPRQASPQPAKLHVSTTKLLGQRIMVGLAGTAADPVLLQRVRLGRVGSVILFTTNIAGRRQLTGLTGELQRAAREGGNPPLLIAIDQEGGQV